MRDPQGLVLAADVGGTNIRTALVNVQGEVVVERREQVGLSQSNLSEDALINVLVEKFQPFLREYSGVQAIGVGFPGFFVGESGVLASSPNLPSLKNVAIAEKLADALHCPVRVQNDALCAALGEQRFGVAQGCEHLLHVTLGTGVGGGLVLHRQAYTGEGGMAMEFGHLCVNTAGDARVCGCGARGCVEAYASATAIQARYVEATGERKTTVEIYQQAVSGDVFSRLLLKEMGEALGRALAEAIKLLDVRTVSISGGLLGAWSIWYEPMMTALNLHLIPPLQGKVTVLSSTLGDHAGVLGAAALAWAMVEKH